MQYRPVNSPWAKQVGRHKQTGFVFKVNDLIWHPHTERFKTNMVVAPEDSTWALSLIAYSWKNPALVGWHVNEHIPKHASLAAHSRQTWYERDERSQTRLNLPAPLLCALLQRNAPKDTYRSSIWRWIFSPGPFFCEQSGLFHPWPASGLFKSVCMRVRANLPVLESSFVIVNQSVKAWRVLHSGQGGVLRLLYDGWMNWTIGYRMAHTSIHLRLTFYATLGLFLALVGMLKVTCVMHWSVMMSGLLFTCFQAVCVQGGGTIGKI